MLLDMSAECEIYFQNNWTATSIEFPDMTLPTTSLDSYISLNFYPITNQRIGVDGTSNGRIAYHGMSQVLCYHKSKKLALKLADDIKTFFQGQQLPKDINVDIGIDYPAIQLDTFFECKVTFRVSQYS